MYKEGENVYWNDPDEGRCSGEYIIKAYDGELECYYIENAEGSQTEAFEEELSKIIF